ncbi:MAG: hypothetical protein R2731_13175 [Nocardioides sp.]
MTAVGNGREVAGVFLRGGVVAFGGPAAHVAMMRDELVRRRGCRGFILPPVTCAGTASGLGPSSPPWCWSAATTTG